MQRRITSQTRMGCDTDGNGAHRQEMEVLRGHYPQLLGGGGGGGVGCLGPCNIVQTPACQFVFTYGVWWY